ncbi:uncharacterized protein LOC143880596 [Tasmannia lanceolata]|uniref:uncharacterized protein LOC143880596 n=1 Tax=Tasmannia lanceolata TaxID=3420 RepID=UPI004064B08E
MKVWRNGYLLQLSFSHENYGKFSKIPEDCSLVLEALAHSYGGRPLILRKWSKDILIEKSNLKRTPIWIRLPNLHLKFWTNTILSKIASGFGKPLYRDSHTADAIRLNFARLCVEVEADTVLPDSIEIKTSTECITQAVEYDWKPSSCQICKTFSHSANSCPLNTMKKVPTNSSKQEWRPISKNIQKQGVE